MRRGTHSIPGAATKALERISVRPIANHLEKMASRIHAVQTAAYQQEAALLDVREFPPLRRTVRDVMASSDAFFGAFDGEELLGVMSVEQRNENEVCISSLTVAPESQRLGVARALVVSILEGTQSRQISVSTGAKNAPALALYQQLGFVERSRKHVGVAQIEIVELAVERSRLVEIEKGRTRK